jgi:hypothetical protein
MAAANDSRLIGMLINIKNKADEVDQPLTATSTPPKSKTKRHTDLKKLPGFGMWADRADMENPAEWVRNLRKPRFHNDL